MFVLTHDWNLGASSGHYERCFDDEQEARNQFDYYKSLIETDEYNFDVKFTPCFDGDNHFSAYENENSPINRQDLVLKQVDCPNVLFN